MASDDHKGLGAVAVQALELLKRHPSGLTIHQIREEISNPGEQEHLNRRVRSIRKQYYLHTRRVGGETIYTLGKRKPEDLRSSTISEKLRAEVIHAAHGRCQMCGRNILKDEIKLQADHKIPESWGGKSERENLWAICEECNRGKRNFFASLPSDEMKKLSRIESVHERIAVLLRMRMNEWVPDYLIETVANIRDQQWDWKKRLRELRYPEIGLKIGMRRSRSAGGATRVEYQLKNWHDLPKNVRQVIREHDQRSKAVKRRP